ncbi:hypothetical protein CC86DRAFT_413957 [Ophiobolus disseminans]|uniref:Uncharacterized protein n=1 Tax=Ophiobolus disseminans TaxID=1469910 RepID=A0A6A6ZBS5_9PLEO|nr:hypothetical protein CC86DRAFT_413957 [Ophiobolus disseminans]
MPFRPAFKNTPTSDSDVQWKSITSTIWSTLNCDQVNDLVISAESVQLNGNNRSATGVQLEVKDPSGCGRKWSWSSLSSANPMSTLNPISSDGLFALWDKACSENTFVLVTGPLAIQASKNYKIEGGSKSTWGAISCRANYWSLLNGTYYTVRATGQTVPDMEDIPTVKKINVTVPPWDAKGRARSFSTPVQSSIVNSSLLYEISSPYEQKTFWGSQQNNTFKDYLPQVSSGAYLCADSPTFSRTWINDRACGMYIMASDIWSFLVAASDASAAIYIPEERWDMTSADIITTKAAWILTNFALLYTIVLRGQGRPTGLKHPASSIAGLAVVFRDTETRKLVEGIDALPSDKAEEKQREVIGKTTLLLRKWPGETGPAVAKPIEHDEEQSAIAVEPTPSLPTDSKAIAKLRYGGIWKIAAVGTVVLLATVALIFVTLWFLILSKKTEFIIWHQPSDNSSFSLSTKGILTQVHKVLFTSLPALAMTIISLWWANVDNYVRRTQPYKELDKGGIGSDTALLDYMHDWNLTVPYRALRKRHWKLGYVTLISLIM